MTFDAIVVGAGAAGLAAARTLAESGKTVLVVEARDRIGGRVFTRTDPRCAAPIELGAEFIHGTPDITLALLRQSGATGIGESGSSWRFDGRTLQPADEAFDSVGELMAKVDREGPDESVDAFLRRFQDDPAWREASHWVRTLVEGFDAADPADAGVQAIAEEWSGDASLQTTQLRPSRGYTDLLDSLVASLPADRVHVALQCIVEEIAWSERGVRVRARRLGQAFEAQAGFAIVTLPIGVLQAGTVRFEPELPRGVHEAVNAIAMGPVIKIALQFATPFWRELQGGRFADAAFFFGERTAFPTFWNPYPVIAPLLVGWAGGPRARQFDGCDEAQIAHRAIADLALMFGVGTEELFARLEASYLHDWQRDPFSLGAYSYVKTGGMRARETLAAPLAGALFFAGEATAAGGEAGTVAGALQSGTRAARLALRRK